jgi:hypothetical protein
MHRWQSTTCLALLLALVFMAGCSQQPDVLASIHAGGDRQLPFDRVASKNGLSPTAKFDPKQIPLGTPIVVRLASALSSLQARPGDSFEAVLVEPIVVEGHTLAPAGSAVTGKVIVAKPAGLNDGPGYLRLTLSAIAIDGARISVETSSLFAKGRAIMNSEPNREPADAKFSTSRPLTFRFEQVVSKAESSS